MADQDITDLVHHAAVRPDTEAPMDAIAARARRRRRRRRTAQGIVSLLVVLAGVGTAAALVAPTHDIDLSPADVPGEQESEPPRPEETTPPEDDVEDDPGVTEPDPEPQPQGPEPLGSFDTADVATEDFPFGGGEYAVLTDVRVAGHPGFDRVVLEFDAAGPPSYQVSYVDPPIIQDGSGEEMAVAGEAFLELRLTPASGYDATQESWEPTYTGPERVTGDTTLVTEVVRTGDFEAMLAWTIGLRAEAPFAVTVLTEPLRLVVDIQAP